MNILQKGLATLGYLITKARKKRIFHFDGIAYTANVSQADIDTNILPTDSSYSGATIIRFSRGITHDSKLPDVLGVAIRLQDYYGKEEHQDILFLSTGSSSLGRHIPFPTTTFCKTLFTTILPYQVGQKRLLVGLTISSDANKSAEALPLRSIQKSIEHGSVRCTVAISTTKDTWQPIATVVAQKKLSQTESDNLKFNPWNTGKSFRPFGYIHGLRREIYNQSQRGR